MAKRTPPKRAEQDSDYDGAWKDALRRHLQAVVTTFFPALSALIDWRYPPEWLDKELGQILAREGRRSGHVDLLFRVRLLNGQETWILFHLEIQTAPEEGFPFRLTRYNSGIVWAYGQRVVTLAILADLKEDWLPEQDQFQLGAFETRTRFPVCKLIQWLPEWQDNHTLSVELARAQIAALQTAGDPEGRYRAKWQLVRNLYRAGYAADELREAFRLIDWMMKLNKSFDERFAIELSQFEKETEMPYVTSVERVLRSRLRKEGRKKGRKEGRKEGSVAVIERLLTHKFGALGVDARRQLGTLSFRQIARLGELILDFETIGDLKSWLKNNAGRTPRLAAPDQGSPMSR